MNTDYLKYDASSLVEYLRRKLIDSGIYTDQIYPASDLKLLMDLFAWTFEVIQYVLNNNAADVMFTDTTLYENMNRLTKLLSYSPKAFRTSTAEFSFSCAFNPTFNGVCMIPKYASIESSASDSNGNPIAYSFTDDFAFTVKNGAIIYKDNPILANGSYCRFTFPRNADGSKFESFVMAGIGPNADKPSYVDNDTLEVFVETVSSSGEKTYEKAKIVDSLILEAASDVLACEKRLNDQKEFEVKFGDGIHGRCLEEGSIIHAIYLKSNGEARKDRCKQAVNFKHISEDPRIQ